MDRPEVVDKQVEDAQKQNQETGAPTSLESDGNHDAGTKTEDGDQDTRHRPGTLDHKANEKEDKEDSAGQLESRTLKWIIKPISKSGDSEDEKSCRNSLTHLEVDLPVCLANVGQASKDLLLGSKAVRKNHEETAND